MQFFFANRSKKNTEIAVCPFRLRDPCISRSLLNQHFFFCIWQMRHCWLPKYLWGMLAPHSVSRTLQICSLLKLSPVHAHALFALLFIRRRRHSHRTKSMADRGLWVVGENLHKRRPKIKHDDAETSAELCCCGMTVLTTQPPCHLCAGGMNAWQRNLSRSDWKGKCFSGKRSHLVCDGDTSWREAGRRVQSACEKMAGVRGWVLWIRCCFTIRARGPVIHRSCGLHQLNARAPVSCWEQSDRMQLVQFFSPVY